MLRLHLLAAAFLATAAVPGTALAVASAELYRTQGHTYGRFEARVRFAAGDGVVSSFFLWKDGSEVAGAFWNELDFEKVGADCHLQTNALYGSPASGNEQSHPIPDDLCDAYHDYRFEWTPTYIAWAIDGRELRRDTGATATAFSENAAGGMSFRFNVWPGNANFGGNFDAAILPVRQYISWVQYSSYVDGAFEQEWREEFQGATLPSGWAVGNWASPFNLSTHSARNVDLVDGIAVLSLSADDATGFTGVPPADDGAGAGGTPGGAGSGSAGTGGAVPAGTGGATADGGTPAAGGGASGNGPASEGSESGCSCRVADSREGALGSGAAALLALAWLARRRRWSDSSGRYA